MLPLPAAPWHWQLSAGMRTGDGMGVLSREWGQGSGWGTALHSAKTGRRLAAFHPRCLAQAAASPSPLPRSAGGGRRRGRIYCRRSCERRSTPELYGRRLLEHRLIDLGELAAARTLPLLPPSLPLL
jgi:hypothetical protein